MLDRDAEAPVVAPASTRFRHSISVAEIQNPLLLKGLELWRSHCAGRPFPTRAEMSPRLLAPLLRNTLLVKVLGSAEEFEFRIVGDAIVSAQGASFQGMTTAQIDGKLPGYGRMLKQVYQGICESGEPGAHRGWFERRADGRAFFHESLCLPLGEQGGAVDHLLILGVYAYNDDLALR